MPVREFFHFPGERILKSVSAIRFRKVAPESSVERETIDCEVSGSIHRLADNI